MSRKLRRLSSKEDGTYTLFLEANEFMRDSNMNRFYGPALVEVVVSDGCIEIELIDDQKESQAAEYDYGGWDEV